MSHTLSMLSFFAVWLHFVSRFEDYLRTTEHLPKIPRVLRNIIRQFAANGGSLHRMLQLWFGAQVRVSGYARLFVCVLLDGVIAETRL